MKNTAKQDVFPKPTYSVKGGKLYKGDCVKVMQKLPSESVELIFADPPFNIGHAYAEHYDRQHWSEYEAFTDCWISQCVRVLKPGGSMFVHICDEHAAYVHELLYRGFYIPTPQPHGTIVPVAVQPLQRVNWIILHQEFGQYGESRFIRSKQHLLWFCKGQYTFNVEEVLEPSLRLRQGDKRVKTAKYKGYRPMLDVWCGDNLGRIQGNNAERWDKAHGALLDHPNQLPELYLARIIRAASNPGDTVLDPFCGTGTTAAVSLATGRNAITIEKGEQTLKSARKRISKGTVRDVRGDLVSGGYREQHLSE